MNYYYYERSFNIVCKDWEKNQPEMYKMVFKSEYYQRVNANKYKEQFIKRVAHIIIKRKPTIKEIETDIIEDMIEKRRREINRYAEFVEQLEKFLYYDSDDD